MSRVVRRQAQNWNAETRAVREIERHIDKPKMAPKHATTQNKIESFQRGEDFM